MKTRFNEFIKIYETKKYSFDDLPKGLLDIAQEMKDDDYGVVYYKPETEKAFFELGDSTEVDTEDLENRLNAIGISDVEIADEYTPPKGQGYYLIFSPYKKLKSPMVW